MSEFFPTANNANTDFPSVTEIPENNDSALSVLGNTDSSRVIAEVQASLVIAKKFPRNEQKAIERIKNACGRPSLANTALYSYSRGGTEITGASIRLLETIKVQWGNIDSGWRELERNENRAIVQAYAWDKESNVREERTFEVPLIRYTRKGSYKLSDPRDIYELEANNAARRVRACLQAVIPSDVVEEAVNACIATQQANVDMRPETIKALINAFGELGVNQTMIEKRLNRSITAIQAGHIVQLRTIYKSIIDGIGKVSDFFTLEDENPTTSEVPAVEEKKTEKKPTEKQLEKVFNSVQNTINKYLSGKLNGVTEQDIYNMINSSNLDDSKKQQLAEQLTPNEEEAEITESSDEL